ncbi:MAG: glycosyltransferase family 39 protein [Planctomycetota bacterium]
MRSPQLPTEARGHGPGPRPGRGELLLLVAALALHVLAGAWHVALPGPQYDECLFVNAALGGVDDNFVAMRVFGVPVLVMPYIGALKAWLHAPVFALFGVTPLTLRLPMILVSAARVGLCWALLRRLAGPRPAAVGLVLLALDPSWTFAVRTDWGPTAIMGLCAALALVLYQRWLDSGRWTWLALLWLTLFAGMFDKLQFLWFVVALAVAVVVVHGRVLWTRARSGGAAFWGPTLPALLLLAAVVVRRVLPLMRDTPALGGMPEGMDRLRMLWRILVETLDGRSVQDFVFVNRAPVSSGAQWLLAVAPLLLLAAWLEQRFRRRQPAGASPEGAVLLRWSALLLLLALGQAVLAMATRQVGGAHHFQLVWPLPLLAAILAAAALLTLRTTRGLVLVRPGLRGRSFLGLLLLVGAAGLLVGEARTLLAYHAGLTTPGSIRPRLSPAIYELADRVEAEGCDLVVSTDWGLHTQLFALAPADRRRRYADAWVLFKEQDIDARYGEGLLTGRTAFVLHADPYEEQAPARSRALAWLRERHPGGRVLRVPEADPLYEVWVVEP